MCCALTVEGQSTALTSFGTLGGSIERVLSRHERPCCSIVDGLHQSRENSLQYDRGKKPFARSYKIKTTKGKFFLAFFCLLAFFPPFVANNFGLSIKKKTLVGHLDRLEQP